MCSKVQKRLVGYNLEKVRFLFEFPMRNLVPKSIDRLIPQTLLTTSNYHRQGLYFGEILEGEASDITRPPSPPSTSPEGEIFTESRQ